jgi:hypothetical protein
MKEMKTYVSFKIKYIMLHCVTLKMSSSLLLPRAD